MSIILNTDYLNQSPNKSTRPAGSKWLGVVWHETASPSPDDPHGTLKYNLSRAVGSSYHYLIARDGTIYHYVDERYHVAWHAGVAEYMLDNQRITDINGRFIGIELDGKNNGTPATPAQLISAGKLAAYLKDAYGIPLSSAYHVTHAAVAKPPGRKSDPKCATIAQVLQAASGGAPGGGAPDYAALWGDANPYVPHFGIPTAWRAELTAGRPLGKALSPEYGISDGGVVQVFEKGVIVWRAATGAKVYRLT